MNKLNIKLIVGSTRANRFGEKPAQWIYDLAAARPEIELERLDLRDYPLPFFEEPLPPGFARDNYTNVINSRRLYTTDNAGNRQYLSDTQIAAARIDAQKSVEAICGPQG